LRKKKASSYAHNTFTEFDGWFRLTLRHQEEETRMAVQTILEFYPLILHTLWLQPLQGEPEKEKTMAKNKSSLL